VEPSGRGKEKRAPAAHRKERGEFQILKGSLQRYDVAYPHSRGDYACGLFGAAAFGLEKFENHMKGV
jgi:hypothetical protein